LGTTTIFVTHDQEEAMVLSDRIAIMSNGVLQQFDQPKTIYSRPANLFVAGFIGSPKMNLLQGQVEPIERGLVFTGSDPAIRSELPVPGGTDIRGHVTLGVRPEHVRLSRAEGPGLRGEITLVEPVGSVTYVDVKIGSTVLKASTDPEDDFQDAEVVSVDFQPNRILLFDADSGQRVLPV
jgi:multiple sugar transport system ATP-binding protein